MLLYSTLVFLFVCVVVVRPLPTPSPSPPRPTCFQLHLSLLSEDSVAVTWTNQSSSSSSSLSPSSSLPTVRYYKGACPSLYHPHPPSSSSSFQYSYGASRTYKGYSGLIHQVNLTKLERATTYCYSVGIEGGEDNEGGKDGGKEEGGKEEGGKECDDGKGGWSVWNEFRMESEEVGEFAAFADAGTWGETPFVMQALAEDNNVHMVIHAGDLSYGLEEWKWDDFGKMIDPIARTKPYMIIPGNWDVKPNASEPFVNRFSMPLVYPPNPEKKEMNFFYSFNYSVFHIVMLNSYDPYDSTSRQYKWLEDDLQKAHRDRKKHPWVVVCFHSPMYSSNTGHGGGDEKFRAQIEHLLFRYQVDLVLTGHDHGYERTYPVYNNTIMQHSLNQYDHLKAPVHILVGTAGATSDPWLEQPDWSAHRETSFGWTKVIASHSSLHVVYMRYNRTVGDEFWVQRSYQFSAAYIFAIAMVCFFTVLPLLLYKGLPAAVRNYLMCVGDVTPTPSASDNTSVSVYKVI